VERDGWQRRIGALDPDVDFAEIYRIMATHEFPWDMTQSLGLALSRTYAVPSIRAAVVRRLPPRRRPRYVRELREFAIYPDGYAVERLETFPAGR
jgi:hypothetical protein